jgi:hypothetical protein
MPVVNHSVHRSSIRDAEHRYGCHNRAPFRETVTVDGWRGPVSWPFAMSRECRYDRSLDDSACAGCMHAGSGERYVAGQQANGAT